MKEKILNEDGKKKQEKIKELQGLAEKLGCSLAQLSIGILHALFYGCFVLSHKLFTHDFAYK